MATVGVKKLSTLTAGLCKSAVIRLFDYHINCFSLMCFFVYRSMQYNTYEEALGAVCKFEEETNSRFLTIKSHNHGESYIEKLTHRYTQTSKPKL